MVVQCLLLQYPTQSMTILQSYGTAECGTSIPTGVWIAAKHKLSFCEPRIVARLKDHPLQNQGEKPSRPKQVFGADVTGPCQHLPQLIDFYEKLFVSFSGYGYPFPLKKKSEAQQHFRDLIARLENTNDVPEHTETYVSDHGGDTIMNSDFQRFLSEKGIFGRQHRDIPRTIIIMAWLKGIFRQSKLSQRTHTFSLA